MADVRCSARHLPWTARQLRRAGAAYVAGAVGIGAGWYRISHAASVDGQLRWLVLDSFAVLFVALTSAAFLLVGRRALRRVPLPVVVVRPAALQGTAAPPEVLVTAASMTRYHRTDCLLVMDKVVSAAGRGEHERVGRKPCGMCLP